MSGFSNGFFEKREIDGIHMYIIPAGTTLYRGDSNFTDINDSELLKEDYKFFTPDRNYADKYGIVFEFETTTDLNLVAMDDISDQFFKDAPESPVNIKKIMRENYGYGEKPQTRDSVQDKDKAMSKYICGKKYQGYAANTMKSKGFDDDLNAEVIICNPEKHLKPIRRVTEESKIQSKLYDLQLRKAEHDRVGPRKTERDRDGPPSMGAFDFGDDDEDEGQPLSTGALDFGHDDEGEGEETPSVKRALDLRGGKTKKSKKKQSKKKQSKKKKTKTQKKRKSRKSKTNKK